MPLTCGLIGLPNAGKSTLFRAVTAAHADIASYAFTTIAPNIGVVRIPDPRLEVLAAIFRPERVVQETLEVVDIAGLVRGAHEGEGLGNQFLGHIREVDALLHVVRCFGGPIDHAAGSVDAVRDAEIVDAELLLADLDTVARARAQVIPRPGQGTARPGSGTPSSPRSKRIWERHCRRGRSCPRGTPRMPRRSSRCSTC